MQKISNFIFINSNFVLSQTQTLENQIDKLVYALYDLSAEEIKIVEM
jgi:hypothetical protein